MDHGKALAFTLSFGKQDSEYQFWLLDMKRQFTYIYIFLQSLDFIFPTFEDFFPFI